MSVNTANSIDPLFYKEFLERFVFEGFVNEIPDKLYHYTDSRGLHGALASKSIWFTSFKFMNDYSEFNHGLDILGRKLEEFLNRDEYDPVFVETCRSIWKFISDESRDPALKPYIFCLTKKKDHLSQWRGYGDFGKGFCLEYLVSELQLLSSQSIFLGKVQYDPDMLEALMDDLVQQWLGLCLTASQKNANIINQQTMRELTLLFMQAAYAFAIKMKHHGFEEEEEWRLFKFIDRGSPNLKFRPHKFGLADYYELNIDPHLFIKEITSGPCGPDVSYLKSSIESLPKTTAGLSFIYSKSPTPFV